MQPYATFLSTFVLWVIFDEHSREWATLYGARRKRSQTLGHAGKLLVFSAANSIGKSTLEFVAKASRVQTVGLPKGNHY